MRRLRQQFPPSIPRIFRRDVACVLLVAMTMMVSIVRPFTGTAILLHDHHDSGSHAHVAPVVVIASVTAACHADFHEDTGVPPLGAWSCSLNDTHGLVIVVVGDPQLPAARLVMPTNLTGKTWATVSPWCALLSPPAGPGPGLSGGGMIGGPRHLRTLAAGDRLIATSRALLI